MRRWLAKPLLINMKKSPAVPYNSGSFTGHPLQAFRIPAGWKVAYNRFYDVEPKFRSYDDTSDNFDEDMLHLGNEDAKVAIDLGWYPSHRSTGRFRLVAIAIYLQEDGLPTGRWDKPLKKLRTRSKQKLVSTLEKWLDYYVNYEPVSDRNKRDRDYARLANRNKH